MNIVAAKVIAMNCCTLFTSFLAFGGEEKDTWEILSRAVM